MLNRHTRSRFFKPKANRINVYRVNDVNNVHMEIKIIWDLVNIWGSTHTLAVRALTI